MSYAPSATPLPLFRDPRTAGLAPTTLNPQEVHDACEQADLGGAPVSMDEIQVREARAGEYEEVGRLTQRAYAEYQRPGDPLWNDYFAMLADVSDRARFATVLVAITSDRIVGTATVELDKTIEGTDDLLPGQANFRILAVEPGARGRHVGRRLVEACVTSARGAGKDLATLHTTDQMTAAQRIYRSMGFQRDPARDIELRPSLVLRAFRLPLRPEG